MPIHTVLGVIDSRELGATSMHEHCLIDGRVWFTPPREDPPEDPRMTIENLGFVRWNLVSLEDNLVMNDPELAISELRPVREHGGSGIVDLTVIGIGRRVAELPRISEKSGVHIMVGCGFYIHASHPDWVEGASVDDLVEVMLGELQGGIDGTGIRPALIGEIGTSEPVTSRERKVVRAAGRAGAETGSAVNIHLDPRGTRALEVLGLLLEEGMIAERVVFSHLDEHLDEGYHRAVADSGAVLEYDTFGSEFYFGDLFKDPTDLERLRYVSFVVENGWGGQLVLGCDVWVKAALRAYGGMGYEHLMKRVVPAMRNDLGIDDTTIEQMLVETPRRILDRPNLGEAEQ
jgi:phosphotriesterase-related protein